MYEAKSNGDGTYAVAKGGVVVAGAKVTRISFPTVTTHTLQAGIDHIGGPCVATIDIPGARTVDDVKVVF